MRASAWATPIRMASRRVICLISRSSVLKRSARPSTTPITISVVPTIHRLRKSSSMTSLRSDAQDHDRQRADDDEPAHPGVELPAPLRLEQRQQPGRADAPDVVAEVDEDRQLGADLDHRGEGRARVAPPEELGEDPQVRAAGDRQELGEPLDDAEDDGLKEVPHGEEPTGRVCGEPEGPPWRAPTNLCGMQQRSRRRDRPEGVPSRSRHHDLGTRHRRARGARPAHRLRRGGRHPGRHRRRLRQRRSRGAHRHPDR